MLQRAASNAYSWFWASQIRTKQSKWLDNNLQEMEERVKDMLKLLGEEADSFGKRAEMYYKRRPEVISSVEEAYKAYRALAERYDHISGELHKANHTIATAFPDQVQYAMLEEEDDNLPKAITPINSSKIRKQTVEDLMKKKREGQKKKHGGKITTQMSEENAQEEINRLQKSILVLQTEKEFIKSSYESGIAKYWEIEKQINDMQEEVCYFQDEFNASAIIEDDEARALMTATALKSCEEAIMNLQEQQNKSIELARMESKRIKIARERLNALKGECGQSLDEPLNIIDGNIETEVLSLKQEKLELQSICDKVKQHFEMNSDISVVEIAEKIDELVNKVINLELTVSSQMAQINKLSEENGELEKYLQSLEEEKTVLINDSSELSDRLKQAEEELNRVQYLEKAVNDEGKDVRSNFTDAFNSLTDISEKLQSSSVESTIKEETPHFNTELPNECNGTEGADIHSIEENFVKEGNKEIPEPEESFGYSAQTEIASQNLDGSEKVDNIRLEEEKDPLQEAHHIPHSGQENIEELKQVEEAKEEDSSVEGGNLPLSSSESIEYLKQGEEFKENKSSETDDHIHLMGSEQIPDERHKENVTAKDSQEEQHIPPSSEKVMQIGEQDVFLNLQQLLLNGLEGREKILLAEYTSILRNYKETKKKLNEVEKKSQDYLHDMTELIRELRNANAMKDEEIQSLRRLLSSSKTVSNGSNNVTSNEVKASFYSHQKHRSISNPQNFEMSKNISIKSSKQEDTSNGVIDGGSPHLGDIYFSVNELQSTSPDEEKFRRDIDAVLEENLEFWLRFSTFFHRIQEFQTKVQDLKAEIERLKDDKPQELNNGAINHPVALPKESTVVEKQLRELKTELQVWLEQNALLRRELQCRFSSLCNIQDEIARALETSSATEAAQLTSYQAAKFQGEVLNMQQENNKVENELQTGLDHVRELQGEVEKAFSQLHENFELSGPKNSHHHNFRHFPTKTRIPLRSFLFGSKPKKPSIFACVSPAALQKQHSELRFGHSNKMA
uniref:NAB domain-containing protein n=1 Tax=Ananas comosus var. bracteatus TaxID=296719 RepID=A0A6V7PD00_ANACO|nr:unnamed protein product [Ananas comosus var. bracteatus]